jgi:hypothetical protein
MTFIDNLIEELKKNKGKIRIKAPLSLLPEANWGELNITSLSESPVMLSAPMIDLKFRFQPLLSGSGYCIPCPYRLDNHSNKPLHTHFYELESFVEVSTLGETLKMILGSEYQELVK